MNRDFDYLYEYGNGTMEERSAYQSLNIIWLLVDKFMYCSDLEEGKNIYNSLKMELGNFYDKITNQNENQLNILYDKLQKGINSDNGTLSFLCKEIYFEVCTILCPDYKFEKTQVRK